MLALGEKQRLTADCDTPASAATACDVTGRFFIYTSFSS
jgi:hypothetical protein